MAITDISQLPEDLRQAVAPVTPGAAGPAPVLPIQNALPQQQDQAPPDQQQNPTAATPISTAAPAPGIVDKIHSGINAAAASTPPAQQNKPGQWARQILSGLNSAFSSVQDTLADAANAAKGAIPGEGSLAALGRIRAAQNERVQASKEALTKEDMNRAAIAKTNVDSHYTEVLLHSLAGKRADEANDAAIANGNLAFTAATTGDPDHGVPGAPIIAKNISESELNQAVHNASWDPTKEMFWPTSKVASYDGAKPRVDENGNPVWEKRYSIVGVPPQIVLNDEQAKFLADNGVLTSEGNKWASGQVLPGVPGMAMFQQAHNNHALIEKQKDEREAADLAEATTQQKLAMVKAGKNLGPDFFQIAAQSDLDLNKTLDYITGKHMIPDPTGKNPNGIVDPRSADFAAKHPTAGQDLVNYMGGLKDFTTIRDSQVAETERKRHDMAEEARALKVEQDKKTADLNDQIDAFGNKSTLSDKEFNKRYDAFTNSQLNKTLGTLQGSYQQFQNILGDISQGKMTGAESVVGLFNAIGISATPLAGKGFRINSNTIEEHVGARGLDQAAIAKLQKLDTGAVITPEQMKDYAKIALDVYKSAFVNAANEQLRTLHYTDVLPRGNNQQIDPVTAGMYLQIAGGNPQIASTAATKQGWQATPASFAPAGIPGLPPGAIAARQGKNGPVVGYMLNGKYTALGVK